MQPLHLLRGCLVPAQGRPHHRLVRTGKSFLATALGYQACKSGIRTFYANASKKQISQNKNAPVGQDLYGAYADFFRRVSDIWRTGATRCGFSRSGDGTVQIFTNPLGSGFVCLKKRIGFNIQIPFLAVFRLLKFYQNSRVCQCFLHCFAPLYRLSTSFLGA